MIHSTEDMSIEGEVVAEPRRTPNNLSSMTFLNEALLLPLRNRSVFLPTLALTAAYTGFVHHASILALSGELPPNAMAAAYLLAAVAGPTTSATTAAAAVAAYNERHHMSFLALVLDALCGGLRTSAAATAADGNALWAAHRFCGAAALGFLTMPITALGSIFLTPLLIDLLVALHLAHRLVDRYLGALCSLAVVVSLSEPACGGGTAAIRRAWRLTRENVAWSALLVAGDGFLAGAVQEWCADAVQSALEYTTISSEACESIEWIVRVLVRAGAAVLGVCVVTAFYYHCTQGAVANGAETPGSGRGRETSSFNTLGETLHGMSTIRRILEKVRYLRLQILASLSGAPLVFSVLAATCAWVATQGTSSVFLQNDLVSLRSSLRARYQGSLKVKERGVCPKPSRELYYSFVHEALA